MNSVLNVTHFLMVIKFPVLGSQELDLALQVGFHQKEIEGQCHLPWPLGQVSRAASAHLCFSTPKSFSAGQLSISSSPSLCWYWRLPLPRCNTLHSVLLKLRRLPCLTPQAHLGPSGWHLVLQMCQLHTQLRATWKFSKCALDPFV